jgi:glutamate-5-semialdehyde dehydrogenase
VKAATDENFNTEYLDYKINCRVVDSLDQALAHIDRFGSRHSESIVTKNEQAARKFQNTVDAAAVYWNASTRFTDGFEMGLGGELGISTQKLHVRGPVGPRELTSLRWIGDGSGQIRS